MYNKLLITIVIVLVIAFAALILWQQGVLSKPYYAVYLTTGDLYFGKLDKFPRLSLTDVWFLQQNQSDTENPFRLSKLSDAFWGPQDKLYLVKENIAWKTKLSKESQVVKFITGQLQAAPPTTQLPAPLPSAPQEQLAPVDGKSTE